MAAMENIHIRPAIPTAAGHVLLPLLRERPPPSAALPVGMFTKCTLFFSELAILRKSPRRSFVATGFMSLTIKSDGCWPCG